MSQSSPNVTARAPTWLVVVISAAIVLHLGAVACRALSATSGPWPSPDGMEMARPPQAAVEVDQVAAPYLQAVKMTHNYHFPSNNVSTPSVHLEFRLKDAADKEIARVRLPEDNANPWVRHRQQLLVNWLGNDQHVAPPQTEIVPAPGQEVPLVKIWRQNDGGPLRLETIDVNRVPREHPVFGPPDWSFHLVRSYVRHLCRVHGAEKAELIRHHKSAIPPGIVGMDNVQRALFEEQMSIYGEFTREGKPTR